MLIPSSDKDDFLHGVFDKGPLRSIVIRVGDLCCQCFA